MQLFSLGLWVLNEDGTWVLDANGLGQRPTLSYDLDLAPGAAFGAEIMRLTQTWIRTVYERKFALRNFHRSKEFFGLMLALAGAALLAIGVMGFRLLGS